MKKLSEHCDLVIVIGADNSSNSKRLVETALVAGAKQAVLVADATMLDFDMIASAENIGLSAGASAPEVLINEVIDALNNHFNLDIEHLNLVMETMHFKLPPILTRAT